MEAPKEAQKDRMKRQGLYYTVSSLIICVFPSFLGSVAVAGTIDKDDLLALKRPRG